MRILFLGADAIGGYYGLHLVPAGAVWPSRGDSPRRGWPGDPTCRAIAPPSGFAAPLP